MKSPSKLWSWLSLALPILLVVVGLVLNGYAAIELRQPSPRPVSITIPVGTQQADAADSLAAAGKPQFGHFPYREANTATLIPIGSYAQGKNQRFERLAPEAALALMQMIYAARDDGVWIVPVSGFRTLAAQDALFERQIQRQGSPAAAAQVSAPPGHSEHHTGYAIDLTDGRFPRHDISEQFAKTDAFRWLTRHGKTFGFELSFPENNPQGVRYEPWHWRFVDSLAAQRTFEPARQDVEE